MPTLDQDRLGATCYLNDLTGRQVSDRDFGVRRPGVALLLRLSGQSAAAIGISGDTSCADHEIAKRVRDIANLNPPGRCIG